MKIIVKMKFGSHLYGLNTPQSDTDIKGIYIPEYRDIILGKVPKTSVNSTTGKDDSKNGIEDIDIEMFTLQGFIKMCAQGQTCAVDMLFAPDAAILQSSPQWEYIRENREKLLIGKASSFVGYCRQQANKYGIKGSRMGELNNIITFLKKQEKTFDFPNPKLKHAWDEITREIKTYQHVHQIMLPLKAGQQEEIPAIDILGKKFDQHCAFPYVLKILKKIYDNYGQRAREAKKNNGIDWKALSHAVRVCFEAQELLESGKVTFPFTGAKRQFLMDVKLGNVDYEKVAQTIESNMEYVETLSQQTTLPKKIDQKFWDDYIFKTYSETYNEMPKL